MTDTPTQAPVPDELVKAAEFTHGVISRISAGKADGDYYALADAMLRLSAALSLPRRTEADIRADERERLLAVIRSGVNLITEVRAKMSKMSDADGGIANHHAYACDILDGILEEWPPMNAVTRSQGGDAEIERLKAVGDAMADAAGRVAMLTHMLIPTMEHQTDKDQADTLCKMTRAALTQWKEAQS